MVDVIKASGEKEKYVRNKLCDSLLKAGASKDVVDRVCGKIEKDLKEGTTTEELFKRAFTHLAEEDVHTAARYNLKRGIQALGPAGFLFEQYVERILNAYGYETRRNVILAGVCVSHEVDIVAHKGKEHFLIEAKYHNKGGIKTDVTVAMYAYARLLDIAPIQEKKEAGGETKHSMWLITNTKFTSTAITYGICKHMNMTGWSYPHEHSLERLIFEKRLYPVTVLPSVSGGNFSSFAKEGLMLVLDIVSLTPESLAERIGFKKDHAEQIIKEALACSVKTEKKTTA
ncbi:MAG: restriction endonuclease [bacterium]|nr:restriction endonuclease [bacterium]